jgi:3-oxoadipate enol-lactonase
VVDLAFTRLSGGSDCPALLLVGPSLGTSVEALWSDCAHLLAPRFEVVGWDLPGHGRSRPAGAPYLVDELADGVRTVADRPAEGRPVFYAGNSVGGAVGFQLALDPGRISAVVTIGSAPRIGEPAGWNDRAALVRRAGTPVMVAGSAERWFAPGFADRRPEVVSALLEALMDADRESYALACEALAEFDVRDRVADVKLLLLSCGGRHDPVVPPDVLRAMVPGIETHVFEDCAHQPPVEAPAAVAQVATDFFARTGAP